MLCTARYCRSSVCLSVTHFSYRYRAHIGWNSSKIISRPNSLRLTRWLTPTWAIWCNGNTPQNYGRIEVGAVGPGAHTRCHISEMVKIGPKLLLRTNRKSHTRYTRFRLAPTSMTSDDLERPKRHSCRNKQNFRSLNSFRNKISAKYSGRKREHKKALLSQR